MTLLNGILSSATQVESPHYNERPNQTDISLLVIHNISLPPGEFGGPYVEDFFSGRLNSSVDPFFEQIADLKVSAHLFIKRDGQVIQFVNFNQRAWHAGESEFCGQKNCNDYSIGIELEGADDIEYTEEQYAQLAHVSKQIMQDYPKISLDNICGHSDVAPLRKTDPGRCFDWQRYRQDLY
jgi:AmpD protein